MRVYKTTRWIGNGSSDFFDFLIFVDDPESLSVTIFFRIEPDIVAWCIILSFIPVGNLNYLLWEPVFHSWMLASFAKFLLLAECLSAFFVELSLSFGYYFSHLHIIHLIQLQSWRADISIYERISFCWHKMFISLQKMNGLFLCFCSRKKNRKNRRLLYYRKKN